MRHVPTYKSKTPERKIKRKRTMKLFKNSPKTKYEKFKKRIHYVIL
jgi:hypothetical protein